MTSITCRHMHGGVWGCVYKGGGRRSRKRIKPIKHCAVSWFHAPTWAITRGTAEDEREHPYCAWAEHGE